jgi:beta-galactosidase
LSWPRGKARRGAWGDLRIDGFLGDRKVISRTLSSKGVDQRFHVELDDEEQLGDGIDAPRAVLLVTDEYGNPRPFATGAVELTLEGQGEIVGEHPFALVGGAGAVWLKTGEVENDGTLILRAKHQVLGTKTVSLRVIGTPKEITGVHGLTQEQKTARPPR